MTDDPLSGDGSLDADPEGELAEAERGDTVHLADHGDFESEVIEPTWGTPDAASEELIDSPRMLKRAELVRRIARIFAPRRVRAAPEPDSPPDPGLLHRVAEEERAEAARD